MGERDAVRAVIRQSVNSGMLGPDQATPLLHVLRPEKLVKDRDKQARGHLSAEQISDIFQARSM